MTNKHSHYYKDVSKLNLIDVYRVLKLFEVTDPCLQHAIKKLLVAGGRGAKDYEKDLHEAVDSINRALQMVTEEGGTPAIKDSPAVREFMGVPLIHWPKLLRIPRDKDESYDSYLGRLSKVVVHEVLKQPHPCPIKEWGELCNKVRDCNLRPYGGWSIPDIEEGIRLVTEAYYDKTEIAYQ